MKKSRYDQLSAIATAVIQNGKEYKRFTGDGEVCGIYWALSVPLNLNGDTDTEEIEVSPDGYIEFVDWDSVEGEGLGDYSFKYTDEEVEKIYNAVMQIA